MSRLAVFVITGVLWAVHSIVTVIRPGYRQPIAQGDWPGVLLFSAAIFSLGLSLPMLARWIGGRVVVRVALAIAAGAGLAGVSNLLEDGLGWGWAFWPFVAGTAVIVLGLLILTVAVATTGGESVRYLAVVPAACLLDVLLLHESGGGILVFGAWCFAAAMTRAPSPRSTERNTIAT